MMNPWGKIDLEPNIIRKTKKALGMWERRNTKAFTPSGNCTMKTRMF